MLGKPASDRGKDLERRRASEDEVDVAVANLTSMLEPLLMIFLGIVIGGVVIAMYLPIFGMASAVQ